LLCGKKAGQKEEGRQKEKEIILALGGGVKNRRSGVFYFLRALGQCLLIELK